MPAINGYYLTLGLLVVCTCAGIVAAARFRREVDEDLAPTTAKELLDPLEQAYFSGLMRPEEIERVRASVQKGKLPLKVAAGKPPAGRARHPDDLSEQLPGDDPVAPDAP